jgi:surface antigen
LAGPYLPEAGLKAYSEDTGGTYRVFDATVDNLGQCVWLCRMVRDTDTLPSTIGPDPDDETKTVYWARYMWDNAAKDDWHKGSAPKIGAVMCFGPTTNNKYGHVAIVTGINDDGSVVVWDSNYSSPPDEKVRKRKVVVTSHAELQGYLYAADSDTPPILQPPPDDKVDYMNIWYQFACGGTHIGTSANPFDNILTALTAVFTNGKIHIKAGTVTGVTTLDPGNKTVTIEPDGGSVTLTQ